MSYTPDILVKKSEFDVALRKEFEKFRSQTPGCSEWFSIPNQNKLVEALAHTSIDVESYLNFNQFRETSVYEIEGVEYFWLYTEFSSDTSALLKFLEKHNVTKIIEY